MLSLVATRLSHVAETNAYLSNFPPIIHALPPPTLRRCVPYAAVLPHHQTMSPIAPTHPNRAGNGGMVDADVMMATVASGLQVTDRYASARANPSLDDTQNLVNVSGALQDGRTLIAYSRPLDSGDTDNDIPIGVGKSVSVIWACGETDTLLKHVSKGVAVIAEMCSGKWLSV